jgi:Nuclease-related domain
MPQTNNQKQSVSYLYYFLFGGYLAAEPFFLKQFFAIYLPDFYYRQLTVPISILIGLIGLQKFKQVTNESLIRQTTVIIRQAYVNFLDPKFRTLITSRFQFHCQILFSLFKIQHSQEPMFHVHSKKAFEYFSLVLIFATSCLAYVVYLFWDNLPRYGLLDTSLTTFFCLFSICLTGIAGFIKVVNTAKQVKNAKESDSDLEALLRMLRKELEDWQFEFRLVLPSIDSKPKRDIDVVAISPDNNYFVIELKSHIGKVTWNSEIKKLCQQRTNDPEPLPFEQDFFDQVNKQAKLLCNFRKLSQYPDRILVFWRARVNINPKKRLIRGVKISDPSRLVKELQKRNTKLVKDRTSKINCVN